MDRRNFIMATLGGCMIPTMLLARQTDKPIAVVGVGGLGRRLVAQVAGEINPLRAECFAIDSDKLLMEWYETHANVKYMELRDEQSEYWACGSCCTLKRARQLAHRNMNRIGSAEYLDLASRKAVIFMGGFGRSAGTGIPQVVGWEARKAGAVVVSALIQPFDWEWHGHQAQLGREMRRLQRSSDAVIFVRHDVSDHDALTVSVFEDAERTLVTMVLGMLDRLEPLA